MPIIEPINKTREFGPLIGPSCVTVATQRPEDRTGPVASTKELPPWSFYQGPVASLRDGRNSYYLKERAMETQISP